MTKIKIDPRDINCEDCGRSFETTRANTKFCTVCRTYRDLLYIGEQTKSCLECDQKFALLKRSDMLCGKCDFLTSKKYVEGTCALCHNVSDRLMHKDIRVCIRCARNPEMRTLLLKALVKKRKAAQHD